MLFIDPEKCIDCGACTQECPTSAIFPDVDLPEAWREYQALNAEMAPLTPSIVEKRDKLFQG